MDTDDEYMEASGFDTEEDYWMFDDHEIERCPHCRKEYEEFSDLGCEYCDQRHPGFGTLV